VQPGARDRGSAPPPGGSARTPWPAPARTGPPRESRGSDAQALQAATLSPGTLALRKDVPHAGMVELETVFLGGTGNNVDEPRLRIMVLQGGGYVHTYFLPLLERRNLCVSSSPLLLPGSWGRRGKAERENFQDCTRWKFAGSNVHFLSYGTPVNGTFKVQWPVKGQPAPVKPAAAPDGIAPAPHRGERALLFIICYLGVKFLPGGDFSGCNLEIFFVGIFRSKTDFATSGAGFCRRSFGGASEAVPVDSALCSSSGHGWGTCRVSSELGLLLS